MAGTVKAIERKYMAHYIDTTFTAGSTTTGASWYRLGEDLEEFTIDLSPDTETSKNILGETTFKHKGYEVTASSDPFYCKNGDAMFAKLQDIVDNRKAGDDCKTWALEAHLWDADDDDNYVAYAQPCFVVPKSYGGDTSGYQIPFDVVFTGERVKGKIAISSGTVTFTAD